MSQEPKKRGFAALPKDELKKLCSKAGKTVKPENRPFAKNNDLAKRAGAIGGRKAAGDKKRRNK